MSAIIAIPARYHSSRFPGKPLVKIANKTMLQRVVETAQLATQSVPDTDILVATDDERILEHAQTLNVLAIMTDEQCKTGTDRIAEALKKSNKKYDFVINLQGDAPLTPPDFIIALLHELKKQHHQVVTPVIQLSWEALDNLRNHKRISPFSGTTVIIDKKDNALWFSKKIIPAIRDEEKRRKHDTLSPVFIHIGLYGYTFKMLDNYIKLDMTPYEQLEQLEQLRLIENGIPIKAVKVQSATYQGAAGVDTPEDLAKVEAMLKS